MYKLFLALILCVLPQIVSAQTESVTISVSAQVQGTVEFFTIQTMDFQNIEREDNIVQVDPVESPRAGKMVARGTPGAEFRLDYLRERELINTEGPGVLLFNYIVAGNSIDEQESAEPLDQDVRDLVFNSEGEYYIWVGGNVDLSEIEPGSYEGEFNIEIVYI